MLHEDSDEGQHERKIQTECIEAKIKSEIAQVSLLWGREKSGRKKGNFYLIFLFDVQAREKDEKGKIYLMEAKSLNGNSVGFNFNHKSSRS